MPRACHACRRANSNNFSGPLPVEWGSNASLPAVRVLALHANALTGRLPAEWAEAGWTASLEELYLQVWPLPPL